MGSRHVTTGIPVSEIAKRIGSAWKNLPEQEQKRYNSLYESEKEEYNNAMSKYKGSKEQLEWKEKTGILALEKKAAEKKAAEVDKNKKIKEKAQLAAAKLKAKEKALLRRNSATALLRKRK